MVKFLTTVYDLHVTSGMEFLILNTWCMSNNKVYELFISTDLQSYIFIVVSADILVELHVSSANQPNLSIFG